MKSYGPKPDEKPSTLSVIEGFIVAGLLTYWVKQHFSLNPGWYWIIGVGTLILFELLFMASSVTRIVAMVVATPFIVLFAYGLGTGMVGYPVGFVLGLVALKLSMTLHLQTDDKDESTRMVKKAWPFAVGLYIAVVCIAGGWYHFHPPQNPASTATPANVSPDDDTSQ